MATGLWSGITFSPVCPAPNWLWAEAVCAGGVSGALPPVGRVGSALRVVARPPRGRECAPQGCVAAAPQNCFMAGSASRLGPLAVSRGRDGARELDSACSPGAVQHVGRGIVGHGHAGV